MPVRNKMFKRSSSLTVLRDAAAGASTTITAAAAKGASTITVASATGITAGKSLRVGSGDEIERVDVQGVAALVVTLVMPLARDHASGEAVVEQTPYNLGETTERFRLSQAVETTDVTSDQRRLLFAKLPGYGSLTAAWSFLGFTLYTLCAALGIPFSRVTGAKTASSPLHLVTDFNDVDSVDNACLVATHVLQDGTVRTQELWGVAMDYTGFSVQLATGQAGAVPTKCLVYGAAVEYDGAPPFTASQTYRATKGQLFGRLTGYGVYVPATSGAFSTTVGTAAAADASVLNVVSGTGISAGDLIAVNTDDQVEIHWVESKATNALTLKGKLLRAQAVGVTVTRLAKVRLALTRDGVTLAIAGSTTPLNEGTRTFAVGQQPGLVDPTVTAQVSELTLANLALSLGIPASAIASNRLLRTELLGSAAILGLYCEGMLADGVTVNVLNAWGCAPDLSSVEHAYGGTDTSSYPLAAKPASGLQFYQYTAA